MYAASGDGASGYTTVETGAKAFVNAVNAAGGVDGQKLEYVLADDQSSATGALAAAQKLIQTDHVFAIISESSTFFGADAYVKKAGIPVLSVGFDGPEWGDPSFTNMFSVEGVNNDSLVYTSSGLLMKALGVTSCGAVGYIESPSSQKAVENFQKSCESQGLKAGYLTNVHFGSTDVAPVALKIKSTSTDGVYLATVPNTAFTLAGDLRQDGAKMKSVLVADGYGGDLLASSAAVTAAQGFQFASSGEPVEMNTPATQKFQKDLAAVGYAQTPTFAIQTTYIAFTALEAGLNATGANPTSAKFITALRRVSDFDANGLLSPLKVDFSNYSPDEQCQWVLTLEGKKFVPLPGSPFCGGVVK